MLGKIVEKLNKAKKIAIFTHLNPDGDALGSSFAMKYVLESIGKEAVIYLEKELPARFSYLGSEYVIGGGSTKSDADTALVLDCATFERMGTLADTCRAVPCILSVDHHYSGDSFGNWCHKEVASAATAQIVYKLACRLTEDIPVAACEAMYTGLSTDTGHFKYSNVTPETFETAAALLSRGINHRKITEILYDTVKYEKLIFMGKAAERIEFFAGGRVAMLKCPEDFIGTYGLKYDDVEELPNIALSVVGVEVAILVKDKDETSKRVSLRGKDVLDVSRAASMFGGGGHKNAAAFVAEGDVDAVLQKLVNIITENLGESNV